MKKTTCPPTTIAYVAGCSGGHILPCLTLAKKDHPVRPLFFSTQRSLDMEIIHKARKNKLPLLQLYPLPLPALGPKWLLPIRLLQAIWCTCASFFTLLAYKPSCIRTTGSHIAIPVCLAAWLARVPIDIYEVNAVPGKTTYLLAPLARTLFICHTQTQKQLSAYQEKCVRAQYPLSMGTASTSPVQARKKLGLAPNKTTIALFGGSQGSHFLNTILPTIITNEQLDTNNIQIIHQTGKTDPTNWHAWYASRNITAHTFAYHDSMKDYYAAADIIICRAGAGTLAEAHWFKKPCITVPLETTATTHQVDNAWAWAKKSKLITVVQQKERTHTAQAIYNVLIRKYGLPVDPAPSVNVGHSARV